MQTDNQDTGQTTEAASTVVATVPAGQARAPRNDHEAAQQEAASATVTPPVAEVPDPKAVEAAKEKHKNRTQAYIEKLRAENAELRRQSGGQQAPQQTSQRTAPAAQAASDEPTLEDHNFDVAAFTKAYGKWVIDSTLKERETATQQTQATEKQIETEAAYLARLEEFGAQHSDFTEVVSSIAYQLSPEVQLAIMASEIGPQIAYHLGNNDDDAFLLASIPPHLAADAVRRIAARMSAAPAATAAIAPIAQAPIPQVAPAAKPISKAPAPAPTLGGRSPVDIPPEKMTDEQWEKMDQERRRKR